MIGNIIKGLAIGVANIIPGVSGGTVAVLLGIYEKLTDAIGNFFLANFQKKREYFLFLLQIMLGAILGILLFAKLIEWSIQKYPNVTASFFSLCILPSLFYMIKPYRKTKKIFSFFLGDFVFRNFYVFECLFSKKTGVETTPVTMISFSYGIKLFFCGLLAGAAMIIPGISGSLLLLVFGEYYHILSFLLQVRILPLVYLAVGVALGLVLFSKGIHWLLQREEEKTMFFIAGIVFMSIFQIWISLLS
ncbi:membrane protein [Fusobacterium necrophorum subsp. funduliforme B35]|uniref:Membrane protein n=1 Tax=Fusobacterium necrophorum subsp. funduliforme B35 TaxID=1226633 RepID=A0A0B4EZQ4_9FUSO|nr:membrane protein [Fusobacterium necrophorum subsp. funduliforme B35]